MVDDSVPGAAPIGRVLGTQSATPLSFWVGLESGRVVQLDDPAAELTVTRVEPEVYVPPLPGSIACLAGAADRERALYFDVMERRIPVELGRDGRDNPVAVEFPTERPAHRRRRPPHRCPCVGG